MTVRGEVDPALLPGVWASYQRFKERGFGAGCCGDGSDISAVISHTGLGQGGEGTLDAEIGALPP